MVDLCLLPRSEAAHRQAACGLRFDGQLAKDFVICACIRSFVFTRIKEPPKNNAMESWCSLSLSLWRNILVLVFFPLQPYQKNMSLLPSQVFKKTLLIMNKWVRYPAETEALQHLRNDLADSRKRWGEISAAWLHIELSSVNDKIKDKI